MNNPISGLVKRFTDKNLHVHSVRVLKEGEPFGQWDRTRDERRLLHSVSKSFTSLAVGLAIADAKLTLATRLREYFPRQTAKRPSGGAAYFPGDLCLYDLLRMASGHDHPPLWEDEREALSAAGRDWAEHYLSLPLDRRPGEQFTYSSGDTYMISALFQAAVGETVRDYLAPRLFEPLGIESVRWDASPQGITLGCTGLYLSAEELSRFGQLLLQKGRWNGEQLVPADWIDFVSRRHIDNGGEGDWGVGYGCQFWLCRHGAYRADGAHGQFCLVLPEHQAVVAIASDEDRLQDILDAVWDELLPVL
ncbi:serine hydrolase domain-containing protein [Gorillibacterium sp. sgz500922]|uniref:serine hydrolase domain-containing protein n=1 Tax=Gorillibacterium sp. sgz500922 TaxID=3446694 RepID=UPI003F66891D